MVSRLTHQKGIDLAGRGDRRSSRRWPRSSLVVGTGDRDLVERLRGAQAHHPRRRRPLHRLRRAARAPGRGRRRHLPHALALRAVRHEPDVLQRYGTPPIGQRDRRAGRHHRGRAIGIPLRGQPRGRSSRASRRAIAAYREPARWRGVQNAGMARDFGWSAAPAPTWTSTKKSNPGTHPGTHPVGSGCVPGVRPRVRATSSGPSRIGARAASDTDTHARDTRACRTSPATGRACRGYSPPLAAFAPKRERVILRLA